MMMMTHGWWTVVDQ